MTTNNCSGGFDVLNYGFDTVFKFGPDTFYNWETDNLPVDDLEARTDYLLQAAGGTSSISGATLVLSSTADHANSVYDSIQDIVDRIPKRLTFPLLIELCSYGDLGALDLHGIQCEGDGCIEVVNRNFGSAHVSNYLNGVSKGSALTKTAVTGDFTTSAYVETFEAERITDMLFDASSTRIAKNCYTSGTGGWNDHGKVLCDFQTHRTHDPRDTTFSIVSGAGFITVGVDTLTLSAYDSFFDPTTITSDVSAAASMAGYPLLAEEAGDAHVANNGLWVLAYGNSFSKVKVHNCGGAPVKLTGILVDGATGIGSTLEHVSHAGFDIANSKVSLESVGSVRNKLFGYKIINSDVFAENGMVAYRNYPTAGSTRGSSTTVEAEDSIEAFTSGVGAYLNGSKLIFESPSSLDNDYTDGIVTGHQPYEFARSGYGILMENSTLAGGAGGHTKATASQGGFKGTFGGGVPDRDHTTTFIRTLNNKLAGIKVINSNFEYQGIPQVHLNEGVGFLAENSTCKSMGLDCIGNQKEGLKLVNSTYGYGFGIDKYRSGYAAATSLTPSQQVAGQSYKKPQVCMYYNGESQMRVTLGSSFYPIQTTNMHEVFGNIGGLTNEAYSRGMVGMEGSDPSHPWAQPYIWVDKGSSAELLSLVAKMRNTNPDVSVPGQVVRASDNSTVRFIGTKYCSTVIMQQTITSSKTAQDWENFTRNSAVAALDNSKVIFGGPTKISGTGVAVLAQGNSKMEFSPIRSKDSNILDNLHYNLSGESGNHTKADIHALRSCLVAADRSEIKMYGLGVSSIASDSVDKSSYLTGGDGESLGVHASGGYMQFYPNGYTEDLTDINTSAIYLEEVNSYNSDVTGLLGDQNHIATGGMCVRAVGGSKVDVNCVNFPMGVTASSVSGVYYNIEGSGQEHVETGYGGSGGGGSQLYLWNIADDSRIHAANVLVSGLDPSSAEISESYHGPAGEWANTVALDYYGANGVASTAKGAAGTYHNTGPFRLVFGTRGLTKSFFEVSSGVDLGNSSSLGGTPVDQITGQGYMVPASSVSAIDGADYGSYLKYENDGTEGAVVFGGLAEEIQDPTTGATNREVPVPVIHGDSYAYMRNFLDNSAADLFANAKHCANPRVGYVSIYNSTTDATNGGEGRDSTDTVSWGKGVRSLNIFDLDRLV